MRLSLIVVAIGGNCGSGVVVVLAVVCPCHLSAVLTVFVMVFRLRFLRSPLSSVRSSPVFSFRLGRESTEKLRVRGQLGSGPSFAGTSALGDQVCQRAPRCVSGHLCFDGMFCSIRLFLGYVCSHFCARLCRGVIVPR